MVKRDKILEAADKYLNASLFKDYAPVGLQVEGAAEVKRIALGVSLSMAFLKEAKKAGAQMVIVHHGMFWKNESSVLKGPLKERVSFLLNNDITLAAYHLCLDAHPVVGNNAQIVKMLGVRKKEAFGDYHGVLLGFSGSFAKPLPLKTIVKRLEPLTPGAPYCIPGKKSSIKRFAVASGGAGSMFQQAIDAGLDLFITGEPWEPAQAFARESGTGYLALGHYNSEKTGILALGKWLRKRFDLPVEFVDVPNPV